MDFTRRELTGIEDWISSYEALVADLATGYESCVNEYASDLSCRQRLEEARSSAEARRMWSRVEAADARLRTVLRPTKRCIHGDHPKDNFWFWGYPDNSPELQDDLEALGML